MRTVIVRPYAKFRTFFMLHPVQQFVAVAQAIIIIIATLAGLPEYQHRRLQSVLNAVARLIYRKSLCQHVTPLLRELHWLRSRERVDFKLAVFIFRCFHGQAPRYLSDDIRRVADSNRRHLRSSSSALLTVRPTRLVTMGDRPCFSGCRQ